VVYIVSWPDTHCLLEFASAKSRFCNTGGAGCVPGCGTKGGWQM
jgi:hypothetical protein